MKIDQPFTLDKDVQILSEEIAYDGFFKIKKFKIKHRLFSNQWSPQLTRELFHRPQVAAALPYDPHSDKVVLIEQFRLGAIADDCPWLIEIVAGVDDKGEGPENLIHHELEEEGNLITSKLHKMYEYWVSPGGSDEYLTLYCAKITAPETGQVCGLKEENEDILVHVVSTTEAFNMLEQGFIRNGITIVALQWLQLNKEKLDRQWKDG